MRENATLLEIELDKFVKENPYADSLEIAEYFFNLGVEQATLKNNACSEKKIQQPLPSYYGD